MLRIASRHQQVSSGERARDDESAGFNSIGNNAMTRAMQLFHPLHADGVRARAFDPGAHLVEQRRQVADFRLARTILQNGFAFGQRRRHHQIFGSRHRDLFEDDARAFQALGPRFDVAMLLRNSRP